MPWVNRKRNIRRSVLGGLLLRCEVHGWWITLFRDMCPKCVRDMKVFDEILQEQRSKDALG